MCSASIINSEVFRKADGITHGTGWDDKNAYAYNSLASWHLQRFAHQLGRWVVFFQVRGLNVTCYAVQDDFGNLQMVEVA